MKHVLIFSLLSLSPALVQAAGSCSVIWSQDRTVKTVSIEDLPAKPSYLSPFVSGKLMGTEPTWRKTKIETTELWIAEAKITDFGPPHLVQRLDPASKTQIQDGDLFTLASFSPFPPHLGKVSPFLHLEWNEFTSQKNLKIVDKNSRTFALIVQGNTNRDPQTGREVLSWKQDDREALYDSSFDPLTYKSLDTFSLSKDELRPNSDQAALFRRIETDLQEKHLTSYEVDAGDVYVTIGAPEVRIGFVRHTDGTIIGGKVTVHQKGGMYPDDSSGPHHFDTLKAARDAGVDDGADVSWAASGMFEMRNGKVEWLRADEYLDWTGH